jgi:hypothetical protein
MSAETCTVETGLLKKKPCGQPAVSKCANCEQSICAKHRVPQVTGGKKSGGFLCPECARAWRESEKTVGELPPTPASALPPAEKKPAPPPPAPTPKPAAKPPPAPAAATKPTPPPPPEDSGPLEFTPSKKPEDKK